MQTKVHVVSQNDYDKWVAEHAALEGRA